jgi:hypothetical protein
MAWEKRRILTAGNDSGFETCRIHTSSGFREDVCSDSDPFLLYNRWGVMSRDVLRAKMSTTVFEECIWEQNLLKLTVS